MKDMLYEARGKLAEKAKTISRPRPSKSQERARHFNPRFTWVYRTTTESSGVPDPERKHFYDYFKLLQG
jgi:hypothetical protein